MGKTHESELRPTRRKNDFKIETWWKAKYRERMGNEKKVTALDQ